MYSAGIPCRRVDGMDVHQCAPTMNRCLNSSRNERVLCSSYGVCWCLCRQKSARHSESSFATLQRWQFTAETASRERGWSRKERIKIWSSSGNVPKQLEPTISSNQVTRAEVKVYLHPSSSECLIHSQTVNHLFF